MPQTAKEETNSNEVTVQVQKKPACRIEMNVKASQSLIAEARQNAIKAVSKEVTLPGFRKGKAPNGLIQKKYPEQIEKQMHKTLADLAFSSAQKIAKVSILNNNAPISFDLKSFSEAEAELLFSFETEPSVPKVDHSQFQPSPPKRAEVAEKQIDEAIRQMRFFYAKWKPVERAIQDGDYIMIDLDTVDGENTQRVFHHIRFEVSKERMAEWMRKLVEGAKAGDVLNALSEPDEGASEEEKKEFAPKNVRITILKVEEAELPEVDDEFAKKVGAKDVAQMKQSVTDLLNKQANEKVQNELREQVNDFLIDTYPFELPQSLVDTEKKHRLNQLLQQPKVKADWNKMSQEERRKLEEKLSLESAQAVRLFYLSREVVQSAKISVTHQEVQNEAISIYQSHGAKNIEIDQIPKELYALALSKVILMKAQDHILKKA